MKNPKKQSDILLKDYLEYDQWLNSSDDFDEKTLIFKTLKIFYYVDDTFLNEKPYQQLKNMYQNIYNILSTQQELVPIFTFNGVEYGILPNFDDMTFAELVDLDTDDTLKQICILYRPIKERKKDKYLIEPYKADISIYDDLKNKLTLDIFSGFVGFFLSLQKSFTLYTLRYLTETDLEAKQKKDLEESGAGCLGYMNYVQATLLNKKMYSL